MSRPIAPSGWWRPVHQVHVPVSSGGTGSQTSSRVAFRALIAFTVILVLAPQDHFAVLKPLHLALIAGVVAGGTYLAGRFSGRSAPPEHSPEVVLAFLLLTLAVATVPFSLWPGGSLGRITGVFFKALVIFWLLSRVVDDVPRLRAVVWTLSLVSIPLSLSAVKTFLGGGFDSNVDMTLGWDRISGYSGGLTSNPNDLALMINLTIPFTVALLLNARRTGTRIALVFVLLLDIGAVVATYSRGGFLTLMTIAIAYLIFLPRRARRWMLAVTVIVGISALPVIPNGYWHRLSTITHPQQDRTGSAEQRWGLMVNATRFVSEHPFVGGGVGLDVLALREAGSKSWLQVHDIYLEYAVDLGLPGLVLFLALYYQTLKSARYARRISRGCDGEEDFQHLAEAILVALIAFGVSGIFHPNAYQFYFYYIAGLAVAVRAIAVARYGTPRVSGHGEKFAWK